MKLGKYKISGEYLGEHFGQTVLKKKFKNNRVLANFFSCLRQNCISAEHLGNEYDCRSSITCIIDGYVVKVFPPIMKDGSTEWFGYSKMSEQKYCKIHISKCTIDEMFE